MYINVRYGQTLWVLVSGTAEDCDQNLRSRVLKQAMATATGLKRL